MRFAAWRDTSRRSPCWDSIAWIPCSARSDGVSIVWYRAHARLTKAQAKQTATLSLGQIDEVDLTFVNGRAVGSSQCCGERVYTLPAPGPVKLEP